MRAIYPDNPPGLHRVNPQACNEYFLDKKKRDKLSAASLLLAGLGLGLSGCGGGGGGGGGAGPATSVTAPVAVAPAVTALSAYAGTWYGPCLGRMQDTATLSAAAGGANALQLNLVRSFHPADGCQAAAIAIETLSADFSLAYGSTASAAAVFERGAAARQVTLDLVTIAIPAYTRTRSGAAVTVATTNGVRNWCIAYPDGEACSADTGLQAAASAPGALHLDNGDLVLLSPSGGGYLADARYTKARATSTPGPTFQRIDTLEGSGALASSGSTLAVHYTGWLYDAAKAGFKGTQFDSSVGKAPFSFRLGAGQVIPGWDQGLLGMRAGGKRTLILPASLAYGRTGSGTSIPPDAALVFDVELISVQ